MYMDRDSFLLEIETCDFFEDIKEDLKEWFDTSSYDKNVVLPKEYAQVREVNKKRIGMMKDELGNGYMTEFVALSPKVYAFEETRLDNSLIEHKKAKGTMKNVTKRVFSLICRNCLFENKMFNCIQNRMKRSPLSADTRQINKI